MKVILLDKISGKGAVGSEVEVKAGYARNFLFPKNLAVLATPENRKVFEAKRAELEAQAQAKLEAAQALAVKLVELGAVDVSVKVGTEGRLFGSVTAQNLVEVLAERGVEVEKSAVRLPSGAIRETGEHTVRFHLHPELDINVVFNVVAA